MVNVGILLEAAGSFARTGLLAPMRLITAARWMLAAHASGAHAVGVAGHLVSSGGQAVSMNRHSVSPPGQSVSNGGHWVATNGQAVSITSVQSVFVAGHTVCAAGH